MNLFPNFVDVFLLTSSSKTDGILFNVTGVSFIVFDTHKLTPDFILFNIYFPNSGKEGSRLDFKVQFCNELLSQLVELKNEGKNLVITGDYNIAHNPIDVYNPKNCEGKSGYLPEERAWLDELEEAGFVDTFRMFDEGEGNFTWWSYRFKARERNSGWRLDYFFVNEEIKDNVISAKILADIYGSDHCPVTLELDF